MPRQIQVGQIWKKDETGENFIVTKVYNEALATYAMLRKTGHEGEARLRVRVTRTPDGPTLPGFSVAHGADEF